MDWRLAWPAISGARVVAVARRAGDSRLVAGRLGGALRPVPGGSRGAAPSHLDLAGGRMVYLAERRDGSRAVVLRSLGRGDSVVLARSRPVSDTELLSPSFDAGAAVWGALVLSSGPTAPRPCSCVADASLRPLRHRPATPVCTYGNLVGLARSRGVLHLSDDLGTVVALPRGAAPC